MRAVTTRDDLPLSRCEAGAPVECIMHRPWPPYGLWLGTSGVERGNRGHSVFSRSGLFSSVSRDLSMFATPG